MEVSNIYKLTFYVLIVISIFFMITGISASEVDIENETVSVIDDGYVSQDNCQNKLSQSDDEYKVGAVEIYFDASASRDGDGSRLRPYKYLTSDRISYGSTAYFTDGVYELSGPSNIYSSSSYQTTIIGQGQNTIIKSNLNNKFAFTVTPNSYLILKDLTFEGIHINNQGNLEAYDVIFKNSEGFDEYFHPSLTYSNHIYDSSYGGVITCDTPENKITNLKFTNCDFINNNAVSGGVIAAYKSIIHITNCNFYDSTSTVFGGAIYTNYCNLNISNSKFLNSKSKYGGVIYSKNTQLLIHNSNFHISQASSFGGAIASDEARIYIVGSSFDNYTSLTDAGGAIYSINGESFIEDSSFSNGNSHYGGAICNLRNDFSLYDSKFINNSALYYGGALFNVYGNIIVENNTFEGSISLRGGGGVITSRLASSFNLTNNYFFKSSAKFGQVLFFEGDNNTLINKGNRYQDVFYFTGIYDAYLNGEAVMFQSNFLVFSVSNTDDFLILDIHDENLTPFYYDIVDFKIGVENYPYVPVYTNTSKQNFLIFNLTKYNNNLIDVSLSLYLCDLTGTYIFLNSIPLSGNKNYLNERYGNESFNFDEYLKYIASNHIYQINLEQPVSLFNFTLPSQEQLPSSYDSRDYGYVTPVKDQGIGGNCWAFSGLSTLETCFKKVTGITYDFSEENVKNLMSEFSLFGLDVESNEGGNSLMFMSYLASWFGPVFEEYDPYDACSSLSVIYSPVFHIHDINLLPERQNSEDNDLIKKAVKDFGAVSISLKWLDSLHSVSIIGWDDGYRGYDVFGNYAEGAWIFKNSWGTNWEDKGFGYLSYENNFTNAFTFILNQSNAYSKIYQYDFGGFTNTIDFESNNIYYKNKFNATGDEILSAVSTYFSSPSDYTVSVYLNGVLKSTQQGNSPAGYHTITLLNEIPLLKGDEFVVVIKVSNNSKNCIPVNRADYLNRITFEKGISFFSLDGNTWNDLYDYVYTVGDIDYTCHVACIKAFTRPTSLEEINLKVNKFSQVNVNEQVNMVANLLDYYIKDGYAYDFTGFVTFTINDEYYYAEIQDQKASLSISFDKEGTYNLTAQYISNLVISNKVSFVFNVLKTSDSTITLSANDISKYYGDSQKYIATVFNNANPVVGANVKITVNDNVFTVKTNENGEAIYDLNLSPGIYNVKSEYHGKSCVSKFTVKSTVNVFDMSEVYLDSNVYATFLNSVGNFLNGDEISFKINDHEFKERCNDKGEVNLKIDLDAGNYTVSVTNPATGEKKEFYLEILKIDSDFIISANQEGNLVTITADLNQKSATGYVYIILNDEINKVNLDKGIASLVFNNLSPNNRYNVSVTYSGDNNFKVSSGYKEFDVVENIVGIKANPLLKYYGAADQFGVNITNNNKSLSGVNVKVTVGDKVLKKVTDNNGMAYFDIDLDVGVYDALVEYGGVSIMSKITIKSTIDASDEVVEYSKSKCSATFRDASGNLVKNTKVTFKVGNNEFYAITNNYGVATADINLNSNVYDLYVFNPITQEQKHVKLTILKITPSLSLIMDEFDDKYVLRVILSENVSSGNMFYSYNGKEFTSKVDNGTSSIIIPVEKAGNYNIDVQFSGNTNLNSVSISKIFILDCKADKIYSNGFTANYGQNKYLSVKLVNSKGQPIANSNIYYQISGNAKKYHVISDLNGYANIKCNFNPGTYTVLLTSGNYGKTNVKVIIKKLTPTLKAAKKTFKAKTKVKKYAVTLKVNEKALINKKITLKIKGKKFTANTNSKGKATFKIKKFTKKGSFKVKISFKGDKYYNSASKKVKIKIK